MTRWKLAAGFSFAIFFSCSQAWSGEISSAANYWRYKAAVTNSPSSSSNRLGGEYEVVGSAGKLEVFQITDGKKEALDASRGLELKRMIAIGQDERQYLKLPLNIGDSWVSRYENRAAGSRYPTRYVVEHKVTGKEDVLLSAGTFQAFKIEGNANVSSPATIYRQQWIYFYSPDLGAIIKWHHDADVDRKGGGGITEIELIKFGPPRQ